MCYYKPDNIIMEEFLAIHWWCNLCNMQMQMAMWWVTTWTRVQKSTKMMDKAKETCKCCWIGHQHLLNSFAGQYCQSLNSFLNDINLSTSSFKNLEMVRKDIQHKRKCDKILCIKKIPEHTCRDFINYVVGVALSVPLIKLWVHVLWSITPQHQILQTLKSCSKKVTYVLMIFCGRKTSSQIMLIQRIPIWANPWQIWANAIAGEIFVLMAYKGFTSQKSMSQHVQRFKKGAQNKCKGVPWGPNPMSRVKLEFGAHVILSRIGTGFSVVNADSNSSVCHVGWSVACHTHPRIEKKKINHGANEHPYIYFTLLHKRK